MRDPIEVMPNGTEVTVNDIKAVIVAVNIRGVNGEYVTYQCEWWSGREQKSGWFEVWQIRCENYHTRRIGFSELMTSGR